MGGTFDPIHIGHLILGENACLQLGLDSVLLHAQRQPASQAAPAWQSHHRRSGWRWSGSRLRTTRILNFHWRKPMTRVIRTQKRPCSRLTAENPDTDYYFIMGADSLFQFEHWKGAWRRSVPPWPLWWWLSGTTFPRKNWMLRFCT